MPAGGELAALFARRAKVADGDNDVVDDGAGAEKAPSDDRHDKASLPAPAPQPPGRLPPRSSAPTTPGRLSLPTSKGAPPSPKPPASPVPAEEPVKASTPAQNDELKAKFEERNLEAGIPTPSFLLNARKNLKKPGSEKTTVNGYSSDSDVIGKVAAVTGAAATGGLSKSNSFKKTTVSGNAGNQTINTVGKNNSFGSDSDSNKKIDKAPSHGYVKSNSFNQSYSSDSGPKQIEKAPPSPGYAKRNSSNSISYGSSDDLDSNKKTVKKAQPSARYAKSNSFNSAEGGNIHNLRMAASENDAPEDEKPAKGSSSSAAGGSASVKKSILTRASSDSKPNHDTLAARRSRMVASRGVSSTSAANVVSNNPKQNTSKEATTSTNKPKKASPAQMRREKLLSRVRSTQSQATNNNTAAPGNKAKPKQQPSNKIHPDTLSTADTNSAVSFDASKTSVISPKSDEFEVLFADFDFSPTSNSNGSLDSIANEMHKLHDAMLMGSTSTGDGTVATLPTNNIQPRVKVTVSKNDKKNQNKPPSGNSSDVTPEKARLHNASTPKIRGNGNYRMDRSSSMGNDAASTGGNSRGGSQRGSPTKRSHGKGLQTFQEDQEPGETSPLEDYLPDDLPLHSTPRRYNSQSHNNDFSQSYPLRQSPSQMSQMSGLTTPSCFPQESNVPSSTPLGHLQQPMLIGIHETASYNSSHNVNGQVGTGIGSGSAFTSGMEAENRRLREQLSSLKKKLDEKDGIISQLMKRIGDLESMNNATQAQHVSMGVIPTPSTVSASLHSTGARSTGASDSNAMSTLWDHSQPATTGSASTSSFQQHAFHARSASQDTESACLSIPASPRHSQQSSSLMQQAQHQRGRNTKASPITTTTSSTASVTTANSSKSGGRRPAPRSKSLSDSSRKSRGQRKKQEDDRKFVC